MRRSICFVLAAVLILSLFPVNIGVYAAEDEGILVFQEDFKKGNLFWNIGADWALSEEKLTSPVSVGCNAKLKNEEIMTWCDYTLEFDFVIDEYSTTATTWMGFYIRDALFYMHSKGISLLYNGKASQFTDVPVLEDTPYTIRAAANDKFISLYIKKQGDKFFRDLGTMIDKKRTANTILFRSICTRTQISGVRVYVPSKSDLYFSTGIGILEPGEYDNGFVNKENKAVKFTSSNEKVATVTEDGKINAAADGEFILTAADYDGNILDSAMYQVSTFAKRIDFSTGSRRLYVGDHYEVTAQYSPRTVKLKGTDWTTSDDSVVELVGGYAERRCLVAKKEGTAVVTATLRQGGSEAREAKITITVEERPEPEDGSARFALNGVKHEISPYFFGIHHDRSALNDGTPFSEDYHIEVAKEIGFQSVRGPGGSDSQRFNYITGQESSRTYAGDFKGFTLDNIYELPNALDVPMVYCLNVHQEPFGPEEIVEQITELKKHTSKPIIVELGNEFYAKVFEDKWPTVDDYGTDMIRYYEAIKEAHPDVQVAIVALGKDMEKRILADPNNNAFANEEDWEYTQAGRVWYWNEVLGRDYQNAYDIVSNHPYTHQSDISYISQDEYITDHFVFNQDYYLNLLLIDRDYGGKHQVLTEWGDIVETVHGDTDAKERGRRQTMFDPGYGVARIERLFQMLKTGVVEATSYHDLQHSSGFGVLSKYENGVIGNLVKLPTYFAFKGFGELINSNNYYYDIDDIEVKSKTEVWPWCSTLTTYMVNLPEVSAWGVGDENNVKTIAFCNHTDGERTVSVDGLSMKKTWGYAPEEMFPDFLTKDIPAWHYTPMQEDIYQGTEYNEEFAEEIVIPPYSIVFADVTGTPVINENSMAGKVSKLTEYETNHALVLALDHNTAYWDNQKTVVDENENVKPVVKNGRTLLPLRFVSEKMGAVVKYDDATAEITVELGETKVVFTVGSNLYYVNEEEKTLETPPEVTDGRTLIPLRALTEALGKTVFWDDRGLIVISNVPTAFGEPYREKNDKQFTELLALFDGEK